MILCVCSIQKFFEFRFEVRKHSRFYFFSTSRLPYLMAFSCVGPSLEAAKPRVSKSVLHVDIKLSYFDILMINKSFTVNSFTRGTARKSSWSYSIFDVSFSPGSLTPSFDKEA